MRAAYWAAYQAELDRLDARQCKTGYACGSTCISLAKDCKKNPKAATGRERLRRISELASGSLAEGRGLARLRQGEAANKLQELQNQRSQRAQELIGQRQPGRQPSAVEPIKLIDMAEVKGLNDFLARGDNFIESVAPGYRKRLDALRQLEHDLYGTGASVTMPKEELAAHQRREAELNKQLREDSQKLLEAAMRTSLSDAEIDAAFDRLKFSHGYELEPSQEWKDNARKSEQAAFRDYMKLFNGRGIEDLEEIQVAPVRAHRNPSVLTTSNNYKTTIHELAHGIEFEDAKLGELAFGFAYQKADNYTQLRKHAKGVPVRYGINKDGTYAYRGSDKDQPRGSKPVARLNQLVPGSGYVDDEVAFKDEYIHPYVGKFYDGRVVGSDGKLYRRGRLPAGGITVKREVPYVTEVITMGAEQFSTPLKLREFASSDYDHFRFMMALTQVAPK